MHSFLQYYCFARHVHAFDVHIAEEWTFHGLHREPHPHRKTWKDSQLLSKLISTSNWVSSSMKRYTRKSVDSAICLACVYLSFPSFSLGKMKFRSDSEGANKVVNSGSVKARQWSKMSGLSSANDSGMYQPNLRRETEIWPHYFTQQKQPFVWYAKRKKCAGDVSVSLLSFLSKTRSLFFRLIHLAFFCKNEIAFWISHYNLDEMYMLKMKRENVLKNRGFLLTFRTFHCYFSSRSKLAQLF